MKMEDPKITNIKLHITIKKRGLQKLGESLKTQKFKKFGNYLTIGEKHTYIIFPKPRYINITGVKTLEEIPIVIPELCRVFKLDSNDVCKNTLVVDNICATGDFNKKINLQKIQEQVNEDEFSVNFNRDYFPGAFFKHYKNGTIVLFASGKYNILGARCPADLDIIFQAMNAIIVKQ
jgi:TATA-box binding protein (TBP) (component of TFIID and TFIIIB)